MIVRPERETGALVRRMLRCSAVLASSWLGCGQPAAGTPPVAPGEVAPQGDTAYPAGAASVTPGHWRPPPAFALPAAGATDAPVEPECVTVEEHVRNGYALEAEFWFAVHCVVVRLASTDPERAQKLVDEANTYRSGQTSAFMDVYPRLLVSPVKESFENEPSNKAAPVSVYVVDAKVRAALARESTPHLGSGGYRGVCFPWQKVRGHYEVTENAARRLRVNDAAVFSSDAASLLADASQDPDIFAWENLAAHAQTPVDREGLPTDVESAQQAFIGFVDAAVTKAVAACEKRSTDGVRDALYWLGYASHALEDLGPHLGRTNPEHAYNAYVEKQSPDVAPDSIALAEDLASTFLARVARGRLQACVPEFRRFSGAAILLPEKLRRLQLTIDGTPAAMLRYHSSRTLFAAVKENPRARMRWFAPTRTCESVPACKALIERLPL